MNKKESKVIKFDLFTLLTVFELKITPEIDTSV